MRAALYARFSTDMQSAASVEDQLHACRAHAKRLGADVVAEYSDAAISGFVIANRPDVQQLLSDAQGGRFDVVIAESLDRLARSGGDTWGIYGDLQALGVGINTIAHGEIGRMHVGLMATMSELFLEELGRKTKRGQAGVARSGRHNGGRVFGYRLVREFNDDGSYVAGLRAVVDSDAAIVVEIFERYAGGWSPRAIAADLNRRQIRGPRSDGWNASTINGNAARGNGVIHNELYRGVMVWGRQTWSKDRRTGARRSRAAKAADLVRADAEHLRIVPEELWERVRARYASVSIEGGRPEAARRPKHLLSGLVKCGCCMGPMAVGGSGRRLICSARKERGETACANGRTARSDDIEARVVKALREQLLHPQVIEAAIKEFIALKAKARASSAGERQRLERELAETKRRSERLVIQLEDGLVTGAAVRDRLQVLETRRTELEAAIAALPAEDQAIALHPNLPARYRRLAEDLSVGLTGEPTPERQRAIETFRAVVQGVVVHPQPERGRYELEVLGDLAVLLQMGPESKNRPGGNRGGVFLTMGAGARSQRSEHSATVRLRA